jgi:phosphatidylinositol alpha-1,6-mannosyltransferase
LSPEVLLVSKPLSPPFNDSGKVYVRTLIDHLPEQPFRALVARGAPYRAPHVASEEIYAGPGSYQPPLLQNLRVLFRLLRPDRRIALYHFFFAPNPRTSGAARVVSRLSRKPTVQTVLSAPASYEGFGRLLFGDRIVVLSEFMRTRVAQTGRSAVRIYPGVSIEPPVSAERRAAARKALGLGEELLVLYPGDLEFSKAASTIVDAAPDIFREHPRARIVLACRPKTAAAREVESSLRARIAGEPRILFAGEVADMRALLATSALVALPAETTYAKTDLPLVLCEALAEGVPIVVGDVPPLSEILADDVGLAVPPGRAAPLAAAVIELLGDAQRRRRLGQNARALAAERFSGEAMASSYRSVYREIIGAHWRSG